MAMGCRLDGRGIGVWFPARASLQPYWLFSPYPVGTQGSEQLVGIRPLTSAWWSCTTPHTFSWHGI
jgi:hypothetical protein